MLVRLSTPDPPTAGPRTPPRRARASRRVSVGTADAEVRPPRAGPTGGRSAGPEFMETVVGPDGIRRPAWASRGDLVRTYFDTEWGRPVRTESGLLELVVLLTFAGGLTWAGVLRRREGLREAFAGYDADVVAAYDDTVVQSLCHDARLIRNGHKIRAAVDNAGATRDLRASGGLPGLVWATVEGEPPVPPMRLTAIPRSDARSTTLAAALRKAGFVRIGPVSAQALLLASGVLPVRRNEAR